MSSIKSSWTLSGSDSNSDIRDFLVHFWISAPTDQLEFLWNSHFGSSTVSLVKTLHNDYKFTESQVSLRNEIGSYLSLNGLDNDYSLQLMIANFLLSPPGLLKINNVESFFPGWFTAIYFELYEDSQSEPSTPVFSPASNVQSSTETTSSSPESPPQPSFGKFPSTLSDLVNDRIHLNRLLGLSNLFYIDPEDREVMQELLEVREALANAIFACPESDLQSLWSTALGDRYWSLVRSGIQSQQSSPADISIKNKATQMLDPSQNGGFGTPGSINAFLVALLYYLPGSVRIEDVDTKVPAWLLSSYKEIFEIATST